MIFIFNIQRKLILLKECVYFFFPLWGSNYSNSRSTSHTKIEPNSIILSFPKAKLIRRSVAGANKAKRHRRFGDEDWAYQRWLVAYQQWFISDRSSTTATVRHRIISNGDDSSTTVRRRWMAHRQRFNAFFVWVSLFLTK